MAALDLLLSAARASGGRSSPVDVSTTPTLRLTLAVSSVDAGQSTSGGGTISQHASLEVTIETSSTGSDVEQGDWYPLWSTTVYAAGTTRIPPLSSDAFVRAKWRARSAVASVSPQFTFSLTGESI